MSWYTEVLHGKTYPRAWLNVACRMILPSCHGRWLDLGGGNGPSYSRFLPPDCERIATDVAPVDVGCTYTIDANEPLPFATNSFDGVFAMNMIYILREPIRSIADMFRVIRPGGGIVLTLPFFFPETPEPHDYFRWTREGAEYVMQKAGFESITIQAIGGPWAVLGTYFLPGTRWRWLRILWAPIIYVGDRVTKRRRITYGWLVTAKKV